MNHLLCLPFAVLLVYHGSLPVDALSAPATSTREVQVRVQRHLPNLKTPEEARRAWIDFVWEKGGGLPFLSVLETESMQQKRMLIPIGMEEELLDSSDDASVHYRVVSSGLLSTEIVPNTHLGVVTFDSADNGTNIVWDVRFETTTESRNFIWQAVTEQTITDTCKNLQAFVATPQLYKRKTFLRSNENMTPDRIMEQWIQFCWKEGAGLPLPIPPLVFDNVRWIVPPFLKERVVSTSNKGNAAEVVYKVENPGQFTYQVYSHEGRVQFVPIDDKTVQMNWEIEMRPYPEPWKTIVKAFTAAVVSLYARNFKCHVLEGPEATVALKPPRGGGGDDNTLFEIRKDSWIGGVLDAHLKDKRSTTVQTIAILQPWTWGRTAEDDEDGESEQWTEGYLSD